MTSLHRLLQRNNPVPEHGIYDLANASMCFCRLGKRLEGHDCIWLVVNYGVVHAANQLSGETERLPMEVSTPGGATTDVLTRHTFVTNVHLEYLELDTKINQRLRSLLPRLIVEKFDPNSSSLSTPNNGTVKPLTTPQIGFAL
jgi:hypothetical protein